MLFRSTPGAGGDGTASLGLAAGTYAGTDVVGTINGVAGIGRGQFLTGAKGDASEGVTIQYTGSAVRAVGTLALSLADRSTAHSWKLEFNVRLKVDE